jgi:serine-type D-Ala-D-Ala carboxypeptidase/endopeptidase
VSGKPGPLQWSPGRARTRAAAQAEPSEVPSRHAPTRVELEPLVTELLVRHARRSVGVAVGILRDGQTWTIGTGTAGSGRPTPPAADTIFEIGPLTKVFTATLLAGMVDDGVVALDEPVQQCLPAGVVLPVRQRPITLADVAAHTSELPRLPHGFPMRSLAHRRNPYAWFMVDELHAGLPATRLRREPGTRPRYSNLGVRAARTSTRTPRRHELRRTRARPDLPSAPTRRHLSLGTSGSAGALRLRTQAARSARGALGPCRARGCGRAARHGRRPARVRATPARRPAASTLRAAALTQVVRTHHRGIAIGLAWTQLPLLGTDHEVLFHNGGTGGFRSFAAFATAAHTAVVVVSNSARSVDALGFRILERISYR